MALIRDIYLGIGSNVDPEIYLPQAIAKLKEAMEVVKVSTLYRCPAVGTAEGQNDFINGVLHVRSSQELEEFKYQTLRTIEHDLGRENLPCKHSPRTIDIDIIFFGDLVQDDEKLPIPEPELYQRNFIYIPLLEIAPELIDPQTKKSVKSHILSLEHKMTEFRISEEKETS